MLTHRLSHSLVLALLSPLATADGVRLPSPGVIPEPEALVSELGCLNCHGGAAPWESRLAPRLAPRLEEVGAHRSPDFLRRFLADPHGVRPGTSMPDVLSGLPESERGETLEDLVHFLAARGGPLEPKIFEASTGMLEEGRQLLHEVGCVACHTPEESLDALADWYDFATPTTPPEESIAADLYVEPGTLEPSHVPFGDSASKTDLPSLQAFLLDPLAFRPSGRMPSLELSENEARDIAVYLLRDQAAQHGGFLERAGLQYKYYEHSFQGSGMDFSGLLPARAGIFEEELGLPEHRSDQFGFEFTGVLHLEVSGSYDFRTVSDDGSWLEIDGEEVVNNGGTHAMASSSGRVELEAGAHTLRITYFEAGGGEGLEVYWTGPNFEERPLSGADATHRSLTLGLPPQGEPFELDSSRVEEGGKAFERLGCIACHAPSTPGAPALIDCDPGAEQGCTATMPAPGLPRYGWSPTQREAVTAWLAGLANLEVLPPDERATYNMARNRCFVCHRRDGLGGPHPTRRPYFFADGDLDLGEEGRIPPHLDSVGSKLQHEWLVQVLHKGADVRPYLVTRMPQFGDPALTGLDRDLIVADAPDEESWPTPFNTESMLAGRQLVGTDGLGCIQCHKFNGYESLGIPAVDLGGVHERIRYPWFRDLLKDPASINMNTRMPAFLVEGESPVKDVLDGDINHQIDAIWNYLSMGASMPLPKGINDPDSTYEVTIEQGAPPLAVGVFMRGISPRVVAVGTPEHVHYAFDMENSRLAMVWRGRFFNARGTWHGRAGQLELPASDDMLDLPEGPPFALLSDELQEWPEVSERRSRLRSLGRRYDQDRYPIFRYALGEIEIEESLRPLVSEAASGLTRSFELRSPVPVESLWFQGRGGRQAIQFSPTPDGQGYQAKFESRITW